MELNKRKIAKQIEYILEDYKKPPFDWQIENVGFFKNNGEIFGWIHYKDQVIPEPIYNKTADYLIDITDNIKNLADTYNLNNKEDFEEVANFLYKNIIKEINYEEYKLKNTKKKSYEEEM